MKAAAALAFIAMLTFASGCQTGAPDEAAAQDLTREDQQGAITVKVTPLNLRTPAGTLDFRITLDTHSVDLSMDLRGMAILRADTGREVRPVSWPVGSGHHYEGTLRFPLAAPDGTALLQDAASLTLVLAGLDVPERRFLWNLPP